jgi:hypothetical protein
MCLFKHYLFVYHLFLQEESSRACKRVSMAKHVVSVHMHSSRSVCWGRLACHLAAELLPLPAPVLMHSGRLAPVAQHHSDTSGCVTLLYAVHICSRVWTPTNMSHAQDQHHRVSSVLTPIFASPPLRAQGPTPAVYVPAACQAASCCCEAMPRTTSSWQRCWQTRGTPQHCCGRVTMHWSRSSCRTWQHNAATGALHLWLLMQPGAVLSRCGGSFRRVRLISVAVRD